MTEVDVHCIGERDLDGLVGRQRYDRTRRKYILRGGRTAENLHQDGDTWRRERGPIYGPVRRLGNIYSARSWSEEVRTYVQPDSEYISNIGRAGATRRSRINQWL